MSNIMDMVKLRNKPSRNGFDLSRKNLFTAKIGEMLPVACIECIPGDSFDIDQAWFTRTQPVNTAAYTRMREYYDWYFVPTNLLWNKFNTFITQMKDNNQKATGINSNVLLTDEHPYFTTDQIYSYLRKVADENNFFSLNRAELTLKLLQYLDYGDFSDYVSTSAKTNFALNPFPLLAYQKIYQDHVRNTQWEKSYAPACNIDYITGADGTLNLPISDIDVTAENMFDLRYFNWNKDYFMGLLPNAQYGDAASLQGFSLGEATRATNMMILSSGSIPSGQTTQPVTWSRNTIVDSATFPSVLSKDTTSVAVGFDKGSVEILRSAMGLSTDGSVENGFTILALRQAEALQKWKEITQSQQQDFKSQIQAHFGVNVSDAYSERSRYIGGVAGNVDISAVTNSNLTGDNDANIAGYGTGGARGSINFNTDVHGYLMCVYHAVPLLDYSIDGIPRMNLKTKVTDYAIPEFDATGMVSVPLIELSRNPSLGLDYSKLLGYAPRYIDYKTSYDLIHGGFADGNIPGWVAPIDTSYIYQYLTNNTDLSGGLLNYHFFKIPSSVLNPIFGVDVNSSTSTDQLLINCGFDIKAVRNLDRNGLPY